MVYTHKYNMKNKNTYKLLPLNQGKIQILTLHEPLMAEEPPMQ